MAWTGSGQGFSGHSPDSRFQNRSFRLSLDCQPARQWPLLSSGPQGLGSEQASPGECSLWVLEKRPQGLASAQFSAPRPCGTLVLCKAEEFYVCIYATREGDYVLFHHEGGVDVGDVDAKAQKLLVGVDEKLSPEKIKNHLLVHAPENKKELSERVCREVAEGVGGRPTGSGLRAGKAEWSSLPG